ncbi:MAG: 50S ribosomal protein L13 [Chloroflexota bacterium]
MKTYTPKAADIQKQWRVVDASDQVLGRLATQIACWLHGKDKPIFTTHMDTGDYVVVVNAAKIRVTGKKLTDKIYYHHTGYPGGIRAQSLEDLLARHPERVIRHAVKGMLPKNALGHDLLRKLKVYAGPTHPHTSQVSNG